MLRNLMILLVFAVSACATKPTANSPQESARTPNSIYGNSAEDSPFKDQSFKKLSLPIASTDKLEIQINTSYAATVDRLSCKSVVGLVPMVWLAPSMAFENFEVPSKDSAKIEIPLVEQKSGCEGLLSLIWVVALDRKSGESYVLPIDLSSEQSETLQKIKCETRPRDSSGKGSCAEQLILNREGRASLDFREFVGH